MTTDKVLDEDRFARIALIGLGLIGSSIGHAVRRAGRAGETSLAGHIVGHARSQATMDKALEIGFVDSVEADPVAAVRDADLVILSIPVGAFGAMAALIGPHLKPGAILSDVGSVKEAVVRDMSPHLAEGVHLIPGHPVAGTEFSGPESGFAELFDGRWCILTPPPGADPLATEKVTRFWQACGSRVEIMTPKHHDLVLAITSHVPHLIAYNIVGTAADLETVTESEVIKYSAGGFRDFTRIASSDPVMWRDIFLNNREAVIETLGRFVEDLTALQRAIRWGEGDQLEALFTRTRAVRRNIVDAGQETAAPDFGRSHGGDGDDGDSDSDSDA